MTLQSEGAACTHVHMVTIRRQGIIRTGKYPILLCHALNTCEVLSFCSFDLIIANRPFICSFKSQMYREG